MTGSALRSLNRNAFRGKIAQPPGEDAGDWTKFPFLPAKLQHQNAVEMSRSCGWETLLRARSIQQQALANPRRCQAQYLLANRFLQC